MRLLRLRTCQAQTTGFLIELLLGGDGRVVVFMFVGQKRVVHTLQ
jgi:hypothetical protein